MATSSKVSNKRNSHDHQQGSPSPGWMGVLEEKCKEMKLAKREYHARKKAAFSAIDKVLFGCDNETEQLAMLDYLYDRGQYGRAEYRQLRQSIGIKRWISKHRCAKDWVKWEGLRYLMNAVSVLSHEVERIDYMYTTTTKVTLGTLVEEKTKKSPALSPTATFYVRSDHNGATQFSVNDVQFNEEPESKLTLNDECCVDAMKEIQKSIPACSDVPFDVFGKFVLEIAQCEFDHR